MGKKKESLGDAINRVTQCMLHGHPYQWPEEEEEDSVFYEGLGKVYKELTGRSYGPEFSKEDIDRKVQELQEGNSDL
ncbi:MAG: hypothetical protein ACLFS3_02525 [Candidatus Aenigmatarchaeota archaeon]